LYLSRTILKIFSKENKKSKNNDIIKINLLLAKIGFLLITKITIIKKRKEGKKF
jgi:hypothetical protein